MPTPNKWHMLNPIILNASEINSERMLAALEGDNP